MTNEQLAEFIQQGGNDELLPLLWDKTRDLIYMKCGQYWTFYAAKLERHGYSLDDFRQESYNALIFAVKGYDSTKEYKFTTYLNYALKRVIRGLLGGASDVLNQSGTMSLDQPIGEDKDGGELLLGDTVADDSTAAVFEEIEGHGQYVPLHQAVDSLPPELREVIRDYYFKGLSYKQIGERHGYSLEYTRQLRNRALRKLGNNMQLRRLYGADYGFHSTTRHKSLAAFLTSGTSEVEDYVMRRLAYCTGVTKMMTPGGTPCP